MLFAFSPMNASAARETVFDGKISLVSCVQKGGLDFTLFLNALIFNEKFWEEMYEPWKDVFYSNQCHAIDLLGLLDQESAVRSAIRKAFLTCKTEDLPKLKRDYDEILGEIYYVRHVIDRKAVFSTPFGLLKNNPTMVEIPKSKLRQQMSAKYQAKDKKEEAKGKMSKDEFNIYFDGLEIKYNERKKEWLDCPNAAWSDVVEKWDEFYKWLTEDFGGAKSAYEDVAAQAEHSWSEFEGMFTKEFWSEVAGNMVEMSINNESVAFLDIFTGDFWINSFMKVKEMKEFDYKFTSGVTYQDLLSQAEEYSTARNYALTHKKNATKNFIIYGKDSQSSQNFVDELEAFDVNLNEYAFPLLDGLYDVAKALNDKQCIY